MGSGMKDLNLFFQSKVIIFLTLCQTRSFSQTAKLVGISQSAVSKSVTSLEEELGLPLTVRDVRPIRLTAEGNALFAILNPMNQSLQSDILALLKHSAVRLPFRFGSIEAMTGHIDGPILKALESSISSIYTFHGYSSTLLAAFKDSKIDYFVSSNPFFEEPNLYRRFLFREPAGVIMVPASLEIKEPVTWESLRFCGLPRIASSPDSTNAQFEMTTYSRLNLNFVDKIESDRTIPIMNYVANGLGWAMLIPSTVIQYPNFSQGIRFLPTPEPIATRDVYVIARNEEPFISTADKITEVAAKALLESTIPKMIEVFPWSRGHFQIAGKRGLERFTVKI